MADDVCGREPDDRQRFDPLELRNRVVQARCGDAAGEVGLVGVAADHHPAVLAEAGEKHLHLHRRGVLRFVEDHEGIRQRAPAHEGDRRDLDFSARQPPLDLFGRHAVVERVVQGAQIGIDLFLHVAGKETELFARLHRRARQDQSLDAAGDELGDGLRHRQIGLAGARGSEREDHVVRHQLPHIMRLIERARHDRLAPGADHDRRRGVAFLADDAVESRFARHGDYRVDQSGVDLLAADDARMEVVQHFARMGDGLRRALHLNPVTARGDVHAQPLFERQQVRIEFTEQAREQLGLVEAEFGAGTLAGTGGDRLAAHAVLSGCDGDQGDTMKQFARATAAGEAVARGTGVAVQRIARRWQMAVAEDRGKVGRALDRVQSPVRLHRELADDRATAFVARGFEPHAPRGAATATVQLGMTGRGGDGAGDHHAGRVDGQQDRVFALQPLRACCGRIGCGAEEARDVRFGGRGPRLRGGRCGVAIMGLPDHRG